MNMHVCACIHAHTRTYVPECCHPVVRIQAAIDINMVTHMHIYGLLGGGQYRLETLHITLKQTGADRGCL